MPATRDKNTPAFHNTYSIIYGLHIYLEGKWRFFCCEIFSYFKISTVPVSAENLLELPH